MSSTLKFSNTFLCISNAENLNISIFNAKIIMVTLRDDNSITEQIYRQWKKTLRKLDDSIFYYHPSLERIILGLAISTKI